MKIKTILSVLFAVSLFSVFAFSLHPADNPHFKNLKVLPKDITDEQLDQVMDRFKQALGVRCNFCHVKMGDSTSHKFDFANDEKPEKMRAREMMRMTAYLNATYFNPDHSTRPDTIAAVGCYSCHRGNHEIELKEILPPLPVPPKY